MKYKAYEEIDESEFDPELDDPTIDGRWVDEDRGGVGRSRVVARQFRKKDDEVKLNYAGTPDDHGIRCLLSICAESEKRKMVLTDAESAYYQSPSTADEHGRKPVMRGPEDILQRGKLWRVEKSMPGMQDAGRNWSDHQAEVYIDRGGFERCPLDSQIYRKKEPRIRMEAHGDDVAAATEDREAADWHMGFMTENIECTGRIMGLGEGESRREGGVMGALERV